MGKRREREFREMERIGEVCSDGQRFLLESGKWNGGKKKVREQTSYLLLVDLLIIELFEMGKKIKCPTCSKGWCSNHLFQLTPIGKDLYFRKQQKIRLCPRPNKNGAEFQKIFPVMNRDRKFYTPTFILQEEHNFYVENDDRIRLNHDQKADIVASGISELFIPKHGRKKNYCSVCKDDFEDYLDHIKSDSHKKSIRMNKFSSLILEFQNKYEKIRAQSVPPLSDPIIQTPDLIQHKMSIGRAQQTNENSDVKAIEQI